MYRRWKSRSAVFTNVAGKKIWTLHVVLQTECKNWKWSTEGEEKKSQNHSFSHLVVCVCSQACRHIETFTATLHYIFITSNTCFINSLLFIFTHFIFSMLMLFSSNRLLLHSITVAFWNQMTEIHCVWLAVGLHCHLVVKKKKKRRTTKMAADLRVQ